ncbi:MAG: hypothetical protein Ct9H90mP16_10670 [Candidatus Poseidoniales archaeon]|nr:MAG: hypothetical protein Ct9H90mP16_10670 [Candidatus Poseidoniales archaeon]
MSTSEMRRVTAINNGTVIDHIPAGSALSVLRMLGISDDRASPISLVMNVPPPNTVERTSSRLKIAN